MKNKEKNMLMPTCVFFAYCVPWVGLAMQDDIQRNSMWMCVLATIALLGLGTYCRKTKQFVFMIAGNAFSWFSSYWFVENVSTDIWNYYFKAFPYTIRLWQFSAVMVGLQVFMWFYCKNPKDNKETKP